MSEFEISKYLGKWYELAHYPSWFQRNDNYNTMAEYGMNSDGTVSVHNSTLTQGKLFDSYGTAKWMGGMNFRVDFAMPEVDKLTSSGEFNKFMPMSNENEANYVIDRIWTNCYGEYIFAVVTDLRRESMYILSRYAHPSLISYNELMEYVVKNYNRDRLVQTPHFE